MLETKLSELTQAIEKLTAVIAAMQTTTTPTAATPDEFVTLIKNAITPVEDDVIVTEDVVAPKTEVKPTKVAKEETPVEVVNDTPEVVEDQMPNIAELQQQCLAACRKKPELKMKIKNLLAQYGAKIIADVPESKLPEFASALNKVVA